MGKTKQMEQLLNTSRYIIDFLPKQVPAKAKGSFSKVESYFLNGPESERIAGKFTRIVLKLSCYYKIEICENERWFSFKSCHKLERRIRRVMRSGSGFLNILLESEQVLLHISGGALCMIVYNPSESMQKLLAALAASEGLFWRS